MTHTIIRLICISALSLMSVPAWSDDVDDMCHGMAVSGQTEIMAFVQMCKNKNDIALACETEAKKLGLESAENYRVRNFLVPNSPCKDKKSLQTFCAFVTSFDGVQVLLGDGSLQADPSDPNYASLAKPLEQSAKVCGTTREAIHANLCAKADAAKQWEFAFAECPVEGRAIYMRECVKPHTTDGEGGGRVVVTSAADCARQYAAEHPAAKTH